MAEYQLTHIVTWTNGVSTGSTHIDHIIADDRGLGLDELETATLAVLRQKAETEARMMGLGSHAANLVVETKRFIVQKITP